MSTKGCEQALSPAPPATPARRGIWSSPELDNQTLHCGDFRECLGVPGAIGSSNARFAMESTVSTDHLRTALRILVRPAMIANAEKLHGKKVAVEISDDAGYEAMDCNMWLYSATARTSGLLVFGILSTGEITWTARVHFQGRQVSSRGGELARPDAAAEIFRITSEFVEAFVTAADL